MLPFANVSGDASQEFFSDGMTDEITTALAKVPDLRVVARTSAFQFKGEKKDMRAIGQALGATHLIEGSVRKEGNRVRITAQLVQADNGVRVWTESYDRELTGRIRHPEDIATAIAGALRVPLGLQQGETSGLQPHRRSGILSAISPRQGAVPRPLRQRCDRHSRTARRPRSRLCARLGLLAEAYALAPAYEPPLTGRPLEEARRVFQSSLGQRETAAREAIRLDPRHAGGYAALAYIQFDRKNWAAADDLFRQALALDPDDPDALQLYGLTLAGGGRLKQALTSREKLRALEPFVPIYNIITAQIMQANGQSQASIPILEAVPPGAANRLFPQRTWLAMAYAAAGRYARSGRHASRHAYQPN